MKAQNEVGRNERDFINWINKRTNGVPCAMRQVFFDAWKEGYEPAAVFEYLFTEIHMARVQFGMQMTSMQDHYGDALKEQTSFDYAYDEYRKTRDKKMAETKNVQDLSKL